MIILFQLLTLANNENNTYIIQQQIIEYLLITEMYTSWVGTCGGCRSFSFGYSGVQS